MKRKEKLFKRSLSLGLMLSLLAAPAWAATGTVNLGEVTVTYKDAYGNDVTEPTSEAHRDAVSHAATTNERIYIENGKTYYGANINATNQWNNGVLSAEESGGRLEFAAGSEVHLMNSNQKFRSIYIGDTGVASTFAGLLVINSKSNAASRAFHADYGTANFLEGSVTNITVLEGSGAGSMGLVATHEGVINLSGTVNAISHANTSTNNNETGSAVSIGWAADNNGSSPATLNITGSGVLTAATTKNASAISVLQRGKITSAVGSSITATAADASKAALYVNNYGGKAGIGAAFESKGDITLTNTATSGKAIWLTSNAQTVGYGTAATLSIDGTDSSSDVKITGDVLNDGATKKDSLKVSMKGTGSFLTGNNMLTKAGSTELTFDTDTKWTGNNTVNTTDGGIMTTNLKDNAAWIGSNTVENGKNNVNMSGTASWAGSNNVKNGENIISLKGSAKKTDDATDSISGGTNTVVVDEKAIYASDGDVTGGTNNITVKGTEGKYEGNLNVSGGTNAVAVDQKGDFSGNITVAAGGTNSLTGLDQGKLSGALNVTGGTNTGTFAASSAITGPVKVSAGTSNMGFSNSAKLSGSLSVSGGTNSIGFKDTAKLTGETTVSDTGNNTLDFSNSAELNGDLKVTGGTNNGTFADSSIMNGSLSVSGGTSAMGFKDTAKLTGKTTVSDTGNNTLGFSNSAEQIGALEVTGGTNNGSFTDSAIMSGSLSVSGGTSAIGFKDTAKLTGKTTVSGTGNNTLGFSNSAEQIGALNVTGGTNNGSFADSAIMSGDLSVTGGTSEITFGDNTQFTAASTTEGGVNNINLKANAQWTNTTNNANGGTVNITATDAAKLTNLNNQVTAGNSNIVLANNGAWTGDDNVTGGNSSIALKDKAFWQGNMSTTGGTSTAKLSDSSSWYGAATGTGNSNINMNNDSRWKVTADSAVANLTLTDDAKVVLASNYENIKFDPVAYETLTVNELNGEGGSFIFDTDLDSAVAGSETTYGDKLIVQGGDGGQHYVQVSDKSLYSGTEIDGDRKLLMITDLSGANYEFIGKTLDEGGLWQVNPPTFFKEGNNWYLGYIQKEANKDTTVAILDRHTVYNQWTRINNDSLRKRLGDLRYNEEDNGGVWARAYAGRLAADGYKQKYNMLQVGIDETNGRTTYGLAFDHQTTSQSYTYGSGNGSNNNGSLYVTHYTDTGTYWDIIGKYGRVNSKYNTTGNYPDHADYGTGAYSISGEYGKTNRYDKGYFVEPKVQLTYGRLNGETYVTDRNTTVREHAIDSLITRVGVVAGRKINTDRDYYLKLNWFKEFKGERSAHLTSANGHNMFVNEDLSDSWFELGLGGNIRVARKTHIYGDIERSFGAQVEKKWQVNAGVRWEF